MPLPGIAEQNRVITQAVLREGRRLRAFIRSRVASAEDVEDILQDALVELVLRFRLLEPVEQAAAWLRTVARHRIIDRFRRGRAAGRAVPVDAGLADLELAALLPGVPGPESAYLRQFMLEELAVALGELPEAQRAVFVAHEIEGQSFKEIAAATGTNVNTLLARKHDAVRRLRRRLSDIYDAFIDEGQAS